MPLQEEAESLSRRILSHYPSLPRAERLLADVVMGKGRTLSAYKAHELAEEAGVSKATAARFFRRIGYTSFRAARHAVREPEPRVPVPGKTLTVLRSRGLERVSDLHLSTDIQNLRHTFEALPEELVDHCVSALAGADKLWVVGFDDDFALAHYARALLIRVKPDIRFLPLGGFSVPEEFASITSQDVIFGFGIRRRPPLLRRILASGHEAGAAVFLVCNEHAEHSEGIIRLRCRTRGASLFDSVTAPVSLVGYLCAAVAAALGDPAIERLHRIESLHQDWDFAEESRTVMGRS